MVTTHSFVVEGDGINKIPNRSNEVNLQSKGKNVRGC